MTTVTNRQSDDEDDDRRERRMGFLEHLDELRLRIIRAGLAVGIGMLIAFAFYQQLGDFVLQPIIASLPAGTALVYIKPGEGFSFYLNVSLIGGLLLAAPVVAYQLWRFIAPGLYANEKKLVIPFVALTSAGSIGGAAFSHYVLFPALMKFYGDFSSTRMRFMPGVEDTVDLYLKMMLGMVVVFQIPTVVFFLARMRLVTARFLWRNFQYAILIIFIIAAALTPSTDPWNQIVFAGPMIGLYLLSIGIAWLVAPGKDAPTRNGSPHLKLVFAAAVVDQAWRQRTERSRRRSDVGRSDLGSGQLSRPPKP
jgi:sec-independent protein translocase protein TatC